jgi:hypothetical protein
MLFSRNGANLLLLAPLGALVGLLLRLSNWRPEYRHHPFYDMLDPNNSAVQVCLMSTLMLLLTGLYINCTILYYRIERYMVGF